MEADDEQINLTRFSLFFPEKRTFFQERSSVFTFDFEPRASLFYSRRIGLFNEEQVPIIGGARVTGMAGKWDMGFLDMQTQAIKSTSTPGGVAGLKALIMFTTRLSISTFVQYNSAENNLISNFRFRYNPKEGNDLYIVVNEGRNTYRNIENPRLPLFNSRSVLLKYTYTFTL